MGTLLLGNKSYAKRLVNVIFSGALLLVALVFYLTYTLDQQYRENARWVIHTHQVLTESERLFSLLKDAQRGQRGYLITRDTAFLKPFVKAKAAVPACIGSLTRLTFDNPTQQDRLKLLAQLSARCFSHWKQIIQMTDVQGPSAAILAVKTGKGKRMLDATEGHIAAFQQHERELLSTRQTQFARSQSRSTLIQISGGVVSLLLLMSAFGLARFRLDNQEQLGRELEAQVGERTGALQQANQELRAGEEELRASEEQLRESLKQIAGYNHLLAESEARFREMAGAAPVMIYMTDKEGKCEYLNQGWLDFTGSSLEQQQGDEWAEGIHPQERQPMLDAFFQAFGQRKPLEVVYRLLRHDGQYRWVLDQGVPRLDGTGKFLGYIGSVVDITAQKEAEQALLVTINQLENYQNALDKSALISITDRGGRIVHANELFCRVSRYEREELLGQDHSIVNSGYHPKEFFAGLWRTVKAGKLWRGEIKNKAKDGSYYWVDTIINPIADHRGKIVRYLSIRYEITSRKQAEAQRLEMLQQLEHTTHHLRNILDSITDAYFTLDQAWRFEEVNLAFEEMVGVSRRQVVGRVIWEAFPEAKELKFYAQYHKAVREQTTVHFEEYFAPLASWFEMSAYPYAEGLMVYFRPINERKQAQVDQLKLIEELSGKNRDLQQFAFITSHNLRAPVANLLGLVNIYNAADPTDPLNQTIISHIGRASQKLDEIIHDLNDLLSVREQVHQPLEEVSFEQVFDDIRQTLQLQLQSANPLISTHFEVTSVLAIRSYVQSILFNLLSNALKYRSPDRPLSIRVETRREGEYLLLVFSDNGLGIDLIKYGEKLFGLYKRFHTHTEGKGLGLHLVKTQAEAVGGKVAVESRPGVGSTFKVYFKAVP